MRRFGLIGLPLSHSFSQKFFTEKFEKENLSDCVYDKFPLTDISQLPGLLQTHGDLRGLNVTIPYKEQVLPFLDKPDEVVAQTGACNCIRISEGRLYGFNTDILGFQISLQEKLLPRHDKALILGKGGAAKAVAYILNRLGISFRYVVRKDVHDPAVIKYDQLNEDIIRSHPLIVNATPLGTFPDVDAAPAIPYEYLSPDHYLYDLVYNPARTLFLHKGEERGATIQNGAGMLVIQAEESWKIWNQ